MADRHGEELIHMLSDRERWGGLTAGLSGLALIAVFVGIAVAALLATGAGAGASTALFSANTWGYTLHVAIFTVEQAALSTLLSVALAVPVALALARRQHFWGRIWIVRLFALPMGLPVLIGALGLIGIWGRQGIINTALSALGLQNPVSIYGLTGILLAHVFFNMPLAIRFMLAALERQPGETWLVAASLGMKSWQTFRWIEAPAIRQVIPGAAGLIFMLCATSFTLVLLLGGGPAATTLEVAIYQALRFDFDPARSVILAFIQIAITLAALLALSWLPAAGHADLTAGRPPHRLDGKSRSARTWDWTAIGFGTLFLALPLASIVTAGARSDLFRLATSKAFVDAAVTSLVIATASAAISLVLTLSLVLGREALDGRRSAKSTGMLAAVLDLAPQLVLLVPPVVIGTGWFLALRPFGDAARFAPTIVVFINAMMALPFVMRVIQPAFAAHRGRTARLAASLGIIGLSRYRRIDLPVLWPALVTAASFAMALSLGDLGAVALFGSGELTTLPWLVYSRLSSYRTTDADGLALLLALLCLCLAIPGAIAAKEQRHG